MFAIGKVVLISALGACLSSCATDGSGINRTQAGAAVGAVAGAVLGHQLDGDAGRYIGAIAGALAGGAAGKYMDDQQRELEAELREERESDQIRISRLADNSLKLDLSSNVSFDINSDQIKDGFHASLDKVAGVFDKYPHTAVHIVGYTDSSGPDAYNQQLSVNRATSVERYLVTQGVDDRRLIPEGRGELSPIASNSTTNGRAQNRRVELVLKPIIEGNEATAFNPPT